MYKLYGNGVDDDTPAIQEMLDSGISVVELPVPQKHYCISKTLKIHANQTFSLGATTTIKLLPQSNCFMITNAEKDAHDIVISGGIWDFNNLNQAPNPINKPDGYGATHMDGKADTIVSYGDLYRGSVMRFYKITRFVLRDLTIKDPVTYCVEMAYIKYFTVENIKFDQNFGNPYPINMDGIHVDGGCQFGSIRNIQGTCYDDIVALNADDGCDGPIEDIQIDGVFGQHALRGVRLLSTKSLVARISVSNVFGTFYRCGAALTYFYPRTGIKGKMSDVCLKNIHVNFAPKEPEYDKPGPYLQPLLLIDGDLDIDFLTINNMCRTEKLTDVETIVINKNTHIKNLSLSNIVQQNNLGKPITFMRNEGTIERLVMHNVYVGDDKLLDNRGEINYIKE